MNFKMKKYFYLSLITFASLFVGQNAKAQFTLSCDGTNDSMIVVSSNSTPFNCTVTNTHSDSEIINWHVDMSKSMLPTGWAASCCDNKSCYAFDGTIHASAKIASGSTGVWATTIDPTGGGIGSGWVVQYMADNFGQTTKYWVSMLTKNTTGISTVNHLDDNVVVFPNPARNEVNVIFNENLDIHTVAICNLIGKAVSVFKTTGNSAKLTIDNIPSGIYFIRLMDANNNVVTTRKFTRL
jgi:hypothetical protein